MREQNMVEDQDAACAETGDRGGPGQDKLREALDLCQRELAQVRARQEEWMEQAAQLPKAFAARDVFASALASRLSADYWARQRPGRSLPGGMRGRAARLLLEFARRPDPEWSQVELIERSEYFDATWYLAEYPDVVAAGYSPAEHYLRHGAAEGRDPGPRFSTAFYLRNGPDVAAAGTNPLVHFVLHGQAEGRQPTAAGS